MYIPDEWSYSFAFCKVDRTRLIGQLMLFYSRLLATLGRCDARRISAEVRSHLVGFLLMFNSRLLALLGRCDARRISAEGRWPLSSLCSSTDIYGEFQPRSGNLWQSVKLGATAPRPIRPRQCSVRAKRVSVSLKNGTRCDRTSADQAAPVQARAPRGLAVNGTQTIKT